MDWVHCEKEVVEAFHSIAKMVEAYDENDGYDDCEVVVVEEHDEDDDEKKLVKEQVACLVEEQQKNEMRSHSILLHSQHRLS